MPTEMDKKSADQHIPLGSISGQCKNEPASLPGILKYKSDILKNGDSTHQTVARGNVRTGVRLSVFMPEINKITRKYYGSEIAVNKEINRTEDQDAWVIHPQSSFRKYWLVIMVVVTSINMVAIPLGVSFFSDLDQINIAWITLNVIIDIIFIIDLGLNFHIGYISDDTDNAVLDLKTIRNHYLKTWFVPDLMAVAPVDYCLLISAATGIIDASTEDLVRIRMLKMIKITRVISLLRLLRFSRLLRFVRDSEEVHGWTVHHLAVMGKFLHMILIIVLVCHWSACFQFLVATLMDYPENSWVTLDGLVDKPISLQYTKAMFRSLCHMMTLNYGSSGVPRGTAEIWVIIISMMVGTVMYALVLAKITSLMTRSNISQSVFEDKNNNVKVFLRHHHLPGDLRCQIYDHLENRYQGRWFDEKSILTELSEPLRQEVLHHNCKTLVSNVFQDTNPLFVMELLKMLEYEMYQKGDLIVRRGALGDCMFFIDRGTVEVETSRGTHTLSDGEFFGEMCLVLESKRSADVRARTPCRLYSLSTAAYKAVLQRFPDLELEPELELSEVTRQQHMDLLSPLIHTQREKHDMETEPFGDHGIWFKRNRKVHPQNS